MSAEFSAHLRFISPEYRIASPGTLIRPTSVAATICQAVGPESSHGGAGTTSRNRAGFKGFLLHSRGTREWIRSRLPWTSSSVDVSRAGLLRVTGLKAGGPALVHRHERQLPLDGDRRVRATRTHEEGVV